MALRLRRLAKCHKFHKSINQSFIELDARISDRMSSNVPLTDIPSLAPVQPVLSQGLMDTSSLTPRIQRKVGCEGERYEPELEELAMSPNMNILSDFLSQAEARGLVIPQSLLGSLGSSSQEMLEAAAVAQTSAASIGLGLEAGVSDVSRRRVSFINADVI